MSLFAIGVPPILIPLLLLYQAHRHCSLKQVLQRYHKRIPLVLRQIFAHLSNKCLELGDHYLCNVFLVDVGYEQGEHVYVVRDQRLQLFHVRLHEAVHSFQQVLYSLFEKLTISVFAGNLNC